MNVKTETKKMLMIVMASTMIIPTLAGKNDKVNLLETPVKVSEVSDIDGFFGQRMQLNRDTYLTNFPIDKYVDFVVDRRHTEWDWTRAEQHGKWIESAYLSSIQGKDKVLYEKAREVLHRIIASQESNGYLGATAKSYRTAERPVRGMDPYELYFVFHAFETVYEETGDKQALNAAERLADFFFGKLRSGQAWLLGFQDSSCSGEQAEGSVR